VLIAILTGKPIGILSFTVLGVLFGLHRPADVSWRDLIVAGMAAAIGFTGAGVCVSLESSQPMPLNRLRP
jgi:Na+/H+ antiporter NhaA